MKTKRNWIIAAIVLMVVGGVIANIALSTKGFNLRELYGQTEEKATYRNWEVEGFTSVQLDSNLSDVTILGSDAVKGEVKAVEEHCTVEVVNGVLQIRQNYPNRKWYQLINFGFQEGEAIQVTLPKAFAGAVQIHNSCGEITVQELETIEKLDCKANLGDINVSGTQAETMNIKSNCGEIDAKQLNGEVLILEADLGDCTVQDAVFQTVKSKIQSGETTFRTVSADKLEAYSALGDIELEHVRSDDLKLQAQSGTIGGTIDGVQSEYTIDVEKALGDSTLNNQTGNGKKLEVEVSLGDIDLTFTK